MIDFNTDFFNKNIDSGVSDYTELDNLPQVNGVTLTGNKSATDLNIYLPNGYTITVATDDSGDFTSLQDALNSLNGKVCPSVVTINISAGTYTLSSAITLPENLLCNRLSIIGHASSDTILQIDWSSPNWTGIFEFSNAQNYSIFLSKIKVKNTGTKKAGTIAFQVVKNNVQLDNLAFDNFTICDRCYSGCHAYLSGTHTFTNCTTPILVNQGIVDSTYGTTYVASNTVTTLLTVNSGGIINMNSNKYSGTITNITSQTIGQSTTNGAIYGVISQA